MILPSFSVSLKRPAKASFKGIYLAHAAAGGTKTFLENEADTLLVSRDSGPGDVLPFKFLSRSGYDPPVKSVALTLTKFSDNHAAISSKG